MSIRMKKLTMLVQGALGVGIAASLVGLPAYGQQETEKVEKIEVTGSAIRRVQSEGALPVQILKREDIDRSGAKSAAELIQLLPVFQNFTTQGDSVGGGGAGFAGAALRNQGETRTLVLLNGKRIASSGSQALTGAQAAVNLNNLPIAAIERVEILSDGASALYGSEAIGGVVNFITRRDVSFGEVQAGFSRPDGGKGNETNFNAVKGFGNLGTDGYNVLVAIGRDDRKPLRSVDREYAKTGLFNFTNGGQEYQFQLGSPSPIPANVVVAGNLITPYYYANNETCAPSTFFLDGACFYDFTTQLEIYPEQKRDNGYFSFTKALGDHQLSLDYIYSKSVTTSRLAPPPGSIPIAASSPYAQIIIDAAAAAGLPAPTFPVVARYRVADVGKRTTSDTSTANHVALELKGVINGLDYATSYTKSTSKYDEVLKGGWVQLQPFLAAVRTPGLINPFVLAGQQSPAAQAALDASVIKARFDGGKTTSDFWEARGSKPIFKLDGGDAQFGAGVAYQKETFDKTPSLLAQGFAADGSADTRFGDTSAIVPYSSSRSVKAFYSEMLMPFSKQFEITPAIRFDNYSDFGNSTNYKVSARYQPTKSLLFRSSIGTGFKAPTVPQLNAADQSFGVTGGTFSCNNDAALAARATALGATCPAGGASAQFDVIAGGNRKLKPEESNQWTVGFRVEPTNNTSIGMDLWSVKIKNTIGSIDEDIVFGDPGRYPQSFTSFVDPATGEKLLALFAGNVNLGKSETRGLDIDTQIRSNLGFGKLNTQLVATYINKNIFEVVPDQGYFDNLGKFVNGEPTFRWQTRLINTLDHGNFSHTLTGNFKSGYADDPTEVLNLATNEFEVVSRDVKRYITFDWQTRWQITKGFKLTAGVLNIANERPPLSITQNGGGQMVGYDARYADSRDRTLYMNAAYRF